MNEEHNRFRKRLTLGVIATGMLLIGLGIWRRLSPAVPRVAWRALNNADSYELISLNPGDVGLPSDGPTFYGNASLGSVQITDPAVRAKLNRALDGGARERREPFKCFEPRHGIRVRHNGVTTVFIICFACGWVHVNRGDENIAYFITGDSPRATFDEVLTEAHVPLATR